METHRRIAQVSQRRFQELTEDIQKAEKKHTGTTPLIEKKQKGNTPEVVVVLTVAMVVLVVVVVVMVAIVVARPSRSGTGGRRAPP